MLTRKLAVPFGTMNVLFGTLIVPFGALLLLSGQSVLAQQQSSPLEEIIVIANRVPVPARQVAASVTVLNEQEIQAHGNFALADVLRQTLGIGKSSNGGTGATSALRIRGEEGYRTLTLFDGLELSDPSAPQVLSPIEHVLSSGVSRVEILRGPQGLSYGADAGGVIAISSRSPEPGITASVDGQTGSRGTDQLEANVAGANARADFTLTAAKLATDGYNVRSSDTAVADDDGYENTSFHGRVGFAVNDSLRLQLVHRNVDGQAQYDGCFAGTTVYDCASRYDFSATRIAADYTSQSINHSLAYTNTRTDREDFASGLFAFGSEGEIARWEYLGSLQNLPGLDVVFGFDLEEENSGIHQRDNQGYFVELLSDFSDALFLTVGARRDDNDDFGTHVSSRITAAYLVPLADSLLKFKASYGSGFRAPSLFEIAYNAGPFAFPPAAFTALAEEASKGFEYGVEYQFPGPAGNHLHLEATLFDQEIEDAIFFDLAGFSGYLQDIGTSSSKGVEVSGRLAWNENYSVSANYTYNETERPTGLQRLRRPEHLANLGLHYVSNSERFRISILYRASADSIDEVFGTTVALDDFDVVDLTASYTINTAIQLYGRIENAFNEDYQEVSDFIAPDRASYIGIRVRF